MNYTQLAEEDRIEIYALKKAGVKQYLIASQLGCHPSTISNELRRNTGPTWVSSQTSAGKGDAAP